MSDLAAAVVLFTMFIYLFTGRQGSDSLLRSSPRCLSTDKQLADHRVVLDLTACWSIVKDHRGSPEHSDAPLVAV